MDPTSAASGLAAGVIVALAVLWRQVRWMHDITDEMTHENERLRARRQEFDV